MKIKLSPARMNEQLNASVSGEAIIVNGESLDFSPLQEGDVLPLAAIDSKWVAGDVQRINGEIHLTLVLPHGANAPYHTRFPPAHTAPMTVTEGVVPLPTYDAVATTGEFKHEY